MDYALDYSAGHPAAATVLADGYVGVVRYIGFDPAQRPKCITAAEYADMDRGGVGVALVYENQAGDALGGRSAGHTAAGRARQWADRIGFPAGRPIYFACDTDVVTEAQFAAVLDYLRGAADVLGGPALVGVYGEYDVIERAAGAGVAAWFWQTMAWSGGRVSSRIHLRQIVGSVDVGGIVCDVNEIRQPDWGQHNTTREDPLAASADDILAEVRYTRDVLYNLTRAQTPDGKPDPGHAEQAVTVANGRLTAIAGAVAKIGAQIGVLTDDEAKILGALDAATTRILTAVGQIITDPQVPNDDPDAVAAALRDYLVRETTPPPAQQ